MICFHADQGLTTVNSPIVKVESTAVPSKHALKCAQIGIYVGDG